MADMDRLPRYRVITGPDDASFCYRVSDILELGYRLHGSPSITTKDGTGYLAQAVIWDRDEPTPTTGTQDHR